ncbi:MAG: hypothetical protein WCJ92_07160 [Alphaproteobacteria bacterium]
MNRNALLRFVGVVLLLSFMGLEATSGQELITRELKKRVCNKAIEIIHKYSIFSEDYSKFAIEKYEKDEDYIYNLQEITKNNIELSKQENFITELNQYNDNGKVLNMMMCSFLNSRFEMLECYENHLRNGELKLDGSERMLEKMACYTTMCQFYDELITNLYLLITPRALSQKTLRLVSCSPSLWPFLKEEKELPDPTQAKYGTCTSIEDHTHDIRLFKYYAVKSKSVELPVISLGSKKHATYLMTPYEKAEFSCRSSVICDISIPEWLRAPTSAESI